MSELNEDGNSSPENAIRFRLLEEDRNGRFLSERKVRVHDTKRVADGDRRLIIQKPNGMEARQGPELVVGLNATFQKSGAAAHIRVQRIDINAKGTATVRLGSHATGIMALEYKKELLQAACRGDESIADIQANETWTRIKLHSVSLERYYQPIENKEGLEKLTEDIKNAYPTIDMPTNPKWLLRAEKLEERSHTVAHSSVIITLRNKKEAELICGRGLWIYGKHHSADIGQLLH
ncbi:hypothetical protein EX30DRAFT_375775 [Ascodesmis nigricans]|uniref:Uncharacterized protein n=1 Tax=Ascodesmis nigricans TaxID=341454 RepID=A0A4V3SHG5_9PEZI|nr:hypothetical protein EX30DRAFT_375775 [Ascodesmis nigricans]